MQIISGGLDPGQNKPHQPCNLGMFVALFTLLSTTPCTQKLKYVSGRFDMWSVLLC